ncbi:hypothetical protein C8J57DRAFT_567758, partial [Mycena rebaudengoi]
LLSPFLPSESATVFVAAHSPVSVRALASYDAVCIPHASHSLCLHYPAHTHLASLSGPCLLPPPRYRPPMDRKPMGGRLLAFARLGASTSRCPHPLWDGAAPPSRARCSGRLRVSCGSLVILGNAAASCLMPRFLRRTSFSSVLSYGVHIHPLWGRAYIASPSSVDEEAQGRAFLGDVHVHPL